MPEREFEISFGTLFKTLEDEQRVDVVVNVGRGNWYSSAMLAKDEKGRRYFIIPGGETIEHIDEIIGQMSVEEMLKAAELGAMHAGYSKEFFKSMKGILIKYSKAKPRILK